MGLFVSCNVMLLHLLSHFNCILWCVVVCALFDAVMVVGCRRRVDDYPCDAHLLHLDVTFLLVIARISAFFSEVIK